MNRLSVLGLLIGLVACICLASPSAAATESSDQLVLTQDPFLSLATVTTTVEEAVKCPCTISSGCPYVGYDCAEPAGCCHCSGPSPSQLKCVYNAQ